ncbi:uncharacterized protein LOC132314263 [Cornus florida]|uniref:uncharacterized protein LOC132314263 n=1 Tax=Cornus florida TaxID=4283 RepID=UPI00289735E4|nr:uncharacterized protein LOC132314263 [Cornus florida]
MLIARGEFASYIQGLAVEQNLPMEQVKRNQKSSSHNTQPVRIINAIHGRPEPTEESDELLRTRLRQAQMKRMIGSVNTLHQQSASTQIKFDRNDLLYVQIPHEDPANVMPRDTFNRLEIKPERLKPTANPLLGFDGKWVEPIGKVEVAVQAVERVLIESFVVVEIHQSYNLLMGRGWIHKVQGVPSTLHQEPSPTQNGEEEPMDLTEEPLADVQIYHDRWSHLDMPRISPSISCHSLNVNPIMKPVRQKQRRFAPERNQIIAEEVDRLLDATFIREVQYPE